MKKIILFVFFTLFISCQEDKPFFDFDEAYLYQISSKESNKFFGDDKSTTQTEKEEFNKIAFIYSYPTALDDKWYFEKIETYYPKKQKIDKSKLKELSNIFTERKEEMTEAMACDPIFRNVFIFKKEGKVVGISKICFDCLEHHTVGTKRNTNHFGSNNEFEKLEKLVGWSDSR